MLFGESADFTAQYPYEHRSLPRCAILGYIYKNDEVHKRILLKENLDFTAQYGYEH